MHQRSAYLGRIHRVVDHIDAHLAQALDLRTLAAIANFSPWHFHRLFQAFTGESVADCVRRRRLEVAAARLQGVPEETALAIAIDVGFGSAEVFTRAFKAHFGSTPSAWRRGAHRQWAEQRRGELSKIHQAQRNPHQAAAGRLGNDGGPSSSNESATMNVTLETLPERHVAYMRHVGPYGDPGIGRLWQRFAAWSAERGLSRPGRGSFGVSRDSPDIAAPGKCRYDACIEVDADFRPAGEVGVQTIPGGLYACTPFAGTGAQIHAAWVALCVQWLPASDCQADDRPALEAYGEQPEVDAQTGAFRCTLCLPVRSA